MPIRVTCAKCHTRFNVSDKFAGKEGPCPKCKSTIKIPAKEDEVVIQAPASTGPKDSKGREIVKPIKRNESSISTVQIVLVAAAIIGFLAVALIFRFMFTDAQQFPFWLLGVAALVLAPPLVLLAYTFLRNEDLDSFVGTELWWRILICSAIYAVTWLALPVAKYAFNDSYEIGSYVCAGFAMIAIGGVTAMFCFDLDLLMGAVHYGLYLGSCAIGRWVAGLGLLPVNATTSEQVTTSWLIDLTPLHDVLLAIPAAGWPHFF